MRQATAELAPPPSRDDLLAAALAYLARYGATEAALRRVLVHRIARWTARARASGEDPTEIDRACRAAHDALPTIIVTLRASGAVNDSRFAEARAARLIRGGRSRRTAVAQLAAKGVDPATAEAAVPADGEAELAAALVLARRRRLGPFRPVPLPDGAAQAAIRRRELGVLARAGFPRQIALCALEMDAATAEALVLGSRRS